MEQPASYQNFKREDLRHFIVYAVPNPHRASDPHRICLGVEVHSGDVQEIYILNASAQLSFIPLLELTNLKEFARDLDLTNLMHYFAHNMSYTNRIINMFV